MSSFWSHVFAHQYNGLKRGVELSLDEARLLVWALRKGDTGIIGEVEDAFMQFITDVTDESTNLLKGNIIDLLINSDPTKPSRLKVEALIAKYGKDAGITA